jgi:serine/threonine-protein kinase HipA
MRRWIARDRGVSAAREMELLLQVGHDLPGAISVDSEPLPSVPWKTAGRDLGLSTISESTMHFSLAGVGMKFSMIRSGERLTIPAHGQAGDWIVKLPDSVFPRVPQNEFAMMSFARDVGIEVPDHLLLTRGEVFGVPESLWPESEPYAYAVKRFDRIGSGRVHIEDFAQVRGVYPDDKYSGSFETIGALSFRGHDTRSFLEFVRRMVFNLAIGNGDAHLKNWSLIYPDRRVARLSPAYDLVSTAAYRLPEIEDLGLKFGGSRDFNRVSRRDFERIAFRLGVPRGQVLEQMEITIEAAEQAWANWASVDIGSRPVSEWVSRSIESLRRRLLG